MHTNRLQPKGVCSEDKGEIRYKRSHRENAGYRESNISTKCTKETKKIQVTKLRDLRVLRGNKHCGMSLDLRV